MKDHGLVQCFFRYYNQVLAFTNKLDLRLAQGLLYKERKKGAVHSIRKEFAPIGSKYFPYRVDPFSEGGK